MRLSKLAHRVADMITFAKLRGYTAGKRAAMSTDDDTVPFLEPYGFTTRPRDGATIIVVTPDRDQEFAILAADASDKPQPAAAGDVIIYAHGSEHRVRLTDAGIFIDSTEDIFVKADGDTSIDADGTVKIGSDPLKGAARHGDTVAITATVATALGTYPVVFTSATISSSSSKVRIE